MSTCRIGVGVAVINRFLFAVGGYDGVNRLASVERYHPEQNHWSAVAPMSIARSGAGLWLLIVCSWKLVFVESVGCVY
jgi:kelch-like protein 19